MMKQWFITGTDTEVGKTVASCALLRAAQAAGYRCAGYKPVAAGCELTADGLRNADALALQASGNVPLTYAQVNPIALQAATSPHIASLLQRQTIELSQMSEGLQLIQQRADWIIIEGAGGWHTPLTSRQSLADWVRQQQLPVILVVGMKLGCINHAILTAQAIHAAGLVFSGWIANNPQPAGEYHQPYLATLSRLLSAPLLGEIPYSPHSRPPVNCVSLAALAGE